MGLFRDRAAASSDSLPAEAPAIGCDPVGDRTRADGTGPTVRHTGALASDARGFRAMESPPRGTRRAGPHRLGASRMGAAPCRSRALSRDGGGGARRRGARAGCTRGDSVLATKGREPTRHRYGLHVHASTAAVLALDG